MSEVIKKALTDKTARNGEVLRSAASQKVMAPWGSEPVA